jgi:hypothetical protein
LRKTYGKSAVAVEVALHQSIDDSLDEFQVMYNLTQASPRERYKQPQTSSQVVGWDELRRRKPEEQPLCSPRQRYPRTNCPETDYAMRYAEGTGQKITGVWTYNRCAPVVYPAQR